MQTFLLSTSFEQSAKWLDNQRLGKQRVEVLQILKALTEPDYGWQNHPAVKMWRGWEWSLALYGCYICDEWIARGYKDTCKDKINALGGVVRYTPSVLKPDWLTEEFASNHRSILLGKAWEAMIYQSNIAKARKAYKVLTWYQSFNWSEKPARKVNGKWPYIWPVK